MRNTPNYGMAAALAAQGVPELCHFPKPRQQSKPCGECHLQTGERCDICGAKEPSSAQAQQVIGQLFQHGETGRTRVVMRDQIADCDAAWFKVGDLVLAATPAPAQAQQATTLHLSDGSALVRDGANWSLRRGGEHIRYLYPFEREFIRAAQTTPPPQAQQAQQAAPERVHQLLAALTTNDDAHARARFASELRSLYGVAPAQAQHYATTDGIRCDNCSETLSAHTEGGRACPAPAQAQQAAVDHSMCPHQLAIDDWRLHNSGWPKP